MQIDIFSPAGTKTKAMELPASLFEAPINWGLMHQFVVMQQSNRRQSGAHVKTRGEVQGSTKKMFAQKHTGRARRGPIRSPLLKGGGKAFGPRNDKNYIKDMPKKMRHAALRSCLSLQASKGTIFGLESYPETVKTSAVAKLLGKMPVEMGRKILLVTNGAHNSLHLSTRNIENVKTVSASYLNPEDVLNARYLIFLADAIEAADKLFGAKQTTAKTTKKEVKEVKEVKVKKEKAPKKTTKKPAAKKKASTPKK
jgi:large subunit ribosomal protein L4